MAGNAAREGELSEQALHTLFIKRNIWIDLAIGPLEVSVRDQTGTAVPGAGDVNHVEVVLLYHPVQVNVEEVQAGCRSPVAEEPWFDVFFCEGLLEQWVVIEIDLADRQVVGSPPVAVH